eukprot:4655531-Prymnesium_polylepis.1
MCIRDRAEYEMKYPCPPEERKVWAMASPSGDCTPFYRLHSRPCGARPQEAVHPRAGRGRGEADHSSCTSSDPRDGHHGAARWRRGHRSSARPPQDRRGAADLLQDAPVQVRGHGEPRDEDRQTSGPARGCAERSPLARSQTLCGCGRERRRQRCGRSAVEIRRSRSCARLDARGQRPLPLALGSRPRALATTACCAPPARVLLQEASRSIWRATGWAAEVCTPRVPQLKFCVNESSSQPRAGEASAVSVNRKGEERGEVFAGGSAREYGNNCFAHATPGPSYMIVLRYGFIGAQWNRTFPQAQVRVSDTCDDSDSAGAARGDSKGLSRTHGGARRGPAVGEPEYHAFTSH